MSGLNDTRTFLLPSRRGKSLSAVCALAAVLVGCAVPVPVREGAGIAATSTGAEPSSHFRPRFATGGPDADAYGAGYGYQVWIIPGDRRMFYLSGLLGQLIFVDPVARLVMVHTAARTIPGHLGAELALWRAVVRELGQYL